MLIDRMRTNPEEFESSRGKFGRVLENTYSARDKKAITEAHDTYIKEPRLMVYVLEALLTQPEKEEMRVKTQGPIRGTTMDKVWFDELNNTVQTGLKRVTREEFEEFRHAKLVQDTATKVTDQSVLSQIYNRTAGRQRIERDN